MTEHFGRDLEPTPESLGMPPGTGLSFEDRKAYIDWVHRLGELPVEDRMALLMWILRSVVAPREHYGKDAHTKPDEQLPIIEWIADRTGLNLEALFLDVHAPHIDLIHMLRAPVKPTPIEET